MPLPKGLGRFNKYVTNPITKPFASRLPWFAVLQHTGRITGEQYSTPLLAWKQGSSIVVALTYGPDVDWLKNSRVSNSRMTIRGVAYLVGRPKPIPSDEGLKRIPAVVRPALALIDSKEFVEFPVSPPSG